MTTPLEALEQARALHHADDCSPPHCVECSGPHGADECPFPCPTRTILDAVTPDVDSDADLEAGALARIARDNGQGRVTLEDFARELGIELDAGTPDALVTVETVGARSEEFWMDLWWEACDDGWAVPSDLPKKFAALVATALTPATPERGEQGGSRPSTRSDETPGPTGEQERTVSREQVERAEWADYFANYDQHVGAPSLTGERVAELLRGPRPFGAHEGRGVDRG